MLSFITTLLLLAGLQDYVVDLPFLTLEGDVDSILDEGMHDFEFDFTLDMTQFESEPTEGELQSVMYACFSEAGASFLSPAVSYFPGNHRYAGVLEIHVPPSPSTDDRNIILRYNKGNNRIFFSQDGQPDAPLILMEFDLEGTDADMSGQFDIILSGSQFGVIYRLLLDGEHVRTMTGTGISLTFEDLSQPGIYSVRAEYGHSVLTMTDTFAYTLPDESEDGNYIATDTYVADGSRHITDIDYYGGLGYKLQSVKTAFSGQGRDLVRGYVYDDMRRGDAKVMLPYLRDVTDSHFDAFHVSSQQAYYSGKGFSDGSSACRVNTFEDGYSGRPLTSRREGEAYTSVGRQLQYEYRLNTEDDSVQKFAYTPPTATASAMIEAVGHHASGNLTVVRTVDEDNNAEEVFSDMDGLVILRRKECGDGNNDTYFVYDMRDSLVCVIQPMGAENIPEEFSYDSDFVKDWCFTYRYDPYGNLIERHVPGAGVESYAYDLRGRMVLSTDNAAADSGIYMYCVYDDLDRIVEEGYTGLLSGFSAVREALMDGEDMEGFMIGKRVVRLCQYYSDTTLPAGFLPEPGVVDEETVADVRCLTLLERERICEEPSATPGSTVTYWRDRTYFYDGKGRVVQILETDSQGWMSRYSMGYDFTGNLTTLVERHSDGIRSDWLRYTYDYDDRSRMTAVHRSLNGLQYESITYRYDDMGRVCRIECGDKVAEQYSYTLQGWPQSQEVTLYDTPEVFQMGLYHYNPSAPEAVPVYGGFVSEVTSCHYGWSPRTVLYGYDEFGRVVRADELSGEKEYFTYDGNGNIRAGVRKNSEGNVILGREYVYDGNLLTGMSGTDDLASFFSHWSDGNLKSDSSEDLHFSYNFSNLLTEVYEGDAPTPKVRVAYLADGTKAAVLAADGSGLVYRGRFIYKVMPGGVAVPESVAHDHGRFVATSDGSNEFIDIWHVTDWLGSVRAVYDITEDEVIDVSDAILEQNDYYAFGNRMEDAGLPEWNQNRHRFNGKERLKAGSVDMTLADYGARMYSAQTARWITPDPLADKYHSVSPYAFSGNNPVNYVDPDGKAIETVFDVVSLVSGVKNLVGNIRSGNVKAAVGDGVGIVLDAAAVFIPGLPGGVGALRTGLKNGTKLLNAADNAVDAVKGARASDTIVDGAKVADKIKFRSFTPKNFRENLARLTGEIPEGMQAHHILPQKHVDKFGELEININDPRYGAWLDAKHHLKHSYEYNKEWENFLDNNSHTKEQVLEYAEQLMKEIYEK